MAKACNVLRSSAGKRSRVHASPLSVDWNSMALVVAATRLPGRRESICMIAAEPPNGPIICGGVPQSEPRQASEMVVSRIFIRIKKGRHRIHERRTDGARGAHSAWATQG